MMFEYDDDNMNSRSIFIIPIISLPTVIILTFTMVTCIYLFLIYLLFTNNVQ